jgi:hypothetical protein
LLIQARMIFWFAAVMVTLAPGGIGPKHVDVVLTRRYRTLSEAEKSLTRSTPGLHVDPTFTVDPKLNPAVRLGAVPPVLWQPANAQLTV